MSHQFTTGDTVRYLRTGLEVEVTALHESNPGLVLCGWFDWLEDYQEVYFPVSELVLVKAAESFMVPFECHAEEARDKA